MKKYLTLILMACLLTIGAMAQSKTPAFMGIPIEGPIEAFAAKVEAKGYVLDSQEDGAYIYTGKFTGVDVTVTIMGGLDNKVAMVGVYLPINETWSLLTSTYDKYLKMYTDKYGEPDIVTREFNGLTPGSNAFHNALENGTALYRDIYIVGNIFITVSAHEAVISETSDGYQILILYLNDDNYIDDEEEGQDDI